MVKGSVRVVVFMVIGICFCFPYKAFSESVGDQTAAYSLGEVIVSGKTVGVESIGTVREITAKDIEMQNARTLDQALRLLPGVSIRTGNDGIPRVDLRGFRSRHVLLLLNGIAFNSAFDGQFDPAIIPVENIAKIKVSYGNSSVLYGQGALGGVINIITRKGTEGVQGNVKLETGERENHIGSFRISGAKDKFNGFISGSAQDSEGFMLSDDFDETKYENGGLRENSDRKQNSLFANLGYSPTDSLEIGLVANTTKGEFGKPPGTIASDDFTSNPKYVRIEDYEGFSGQLSMSYNSQGPFGVRGWMFFNRMDEDENRYDDDLYDTITSKNTYFISNLTKTYGGTIQTFADLKNIGLVTLAVSTEKQSFDSNGIVRDNKNNIQELDEDYNVNIHSTALEYEVSPFDKLGLVFGYSHHWFNKDSGGTDDKNSYLAGIHYDVFENTRIKGSYARKIRFPSIRQLYEEDTGNPDLEPERSNNYELGIEQNIFERTSVSLTGFYIDVKNYIEKVDATDIFENNEQYCFQGIEFVAETRYINNLMLRAGYTYMDTEDKSDNTGKDELQYRPEHKLTFESQYTFPCGLSAYASAMHYANQYFYSKSAPYRQRKLNDITLVNLKLDQSFLKNRLKAYIGVENVTNLDYEEAYSLPQKGRTFYGGIEYSF
ncbi:MAG: TonB-dependent receptor [Pseudomonadota bacterium]